MTLGPGECNASVDMPSNVLTLAGFLDGVLAHANWVNTEEVSTFEREICGPVEHAGNFSAETRHARPGLAARRIRRHRTLVRPKQETLAQVAGPY
jgi:hypothetical protein